MVKQTQEPLKILIVDDNEWVRIVMRDLIETFCPHCRVIEAHNGREGMNIAQVDQPDLIFLDFHMPIMNGYEMALALQQLPITRQIPLILNTSDDDPSPALNYLKRVCRAALCKPLKREEFTEILYQFASSQPAMRGASVSMA